MVKYLRYYGTHGLIAATTFGLIAGGAWCWLGLGAGFAIWVGGDALSGAVNEPTPDYAHPLLLDAALYSLFPPLVVMTFTFVWALSPADIFGFGTWLGSVLDLDVLARRGDPAAAHIIGACLSFGLAMAMGGILTAHELMHRIDDPVAMWVTRWMLAMAFNATLEVAHVFGHHRDVGTPADPATARRGETIYHFYIRSTGGQFLQAWRIERERLRAAGHSALTWRNKVVDGLLRSSIVAGLFFLAGGGLALTAFLAASAWNKFLLESLNYIEHYGLVRIPGEPIEPRHAWDSLSRFSHAALFNLPWHADHHGRIGVKYPALRRTASAPTLPFGYLAALPIVWLPPLWRRMIARRLRDWETNVASAAEQGLLAIEPNNPPSR
jgi:alkane 1-monooxygenase